ncbi:ABC transporter ATP-binding protein [Levilactobacillus brevis]|uniref:ATP-binding cassette domain-containing protein n=1 Tax=Levilactobacillus brevis TaxID=1580 RepID=A0AA41ENH2_LEVBR|nr:ATP-binding cassette domain-containing protein [Levilactobacillus brevis]MBS0946674.1 ATP-binding cassette domain-containing protein [Levilactobacillus brevis]MBS1009913.1 ATP-binding cassette domain-containing protein [Levilactobacillus brevis]MCU0200361.1 ATP-binding cassette domain-containing protein [Levilactobacillus brevis]ODP93562.1 ABC transporter ATP-binding protein [Levilactobacillus brevis]ORJ56708.1 ABC transporter ATP-binding protein [Levilactobacillus brevis]
MQQPAVLSVKHLQKVFFPGTVNERHVLKNVSLEITPGDFVAVIGNNGAGKSTLLNTIAGTLPVDAGEMTLAGHRVTKKSVAYRAKWLSRVFQDPKMGTAGELSVAQNLTLAQEHTGSMSLRRYRRADQLTAYQELLRPLEMGLEDRLTTQVKYLSGGQRQALSLLMATLSQPELLLLDEHTAALDPQTSQKVMDLTQKIVTSHHLTTMMITHKMSDALTYGNRLVMVQDGQIKLDVRGAEKANLRAEDLLTLFTATD